MFWIDLSCCCRKSINLSKTSGGNMASSRWRFGRTKGNTQHRWTKIWDLTGFHNIWRAGNHSMMCDCCLVLCAILTFLHAGAQKQQVKVAWWHQLIHVDIFCRSQPCKTGSHCPKTNKITKHDGFHQIQKRIYVNWRPTFENNNVCEGNLH